MLAFITLCIKVFFEIFKVAHESVQAKTREKEYDQSQEERDKLNANPAAWFESHFNRLSGQSNQSPVSDTNSTDNTKSANA